MRSWKRDALGLIDKLAPALGYVRADSAPVSAPESAPEPRTTAPAPPSHAPEPPAPATALPGAPDAALAPVTAEQGASEPVAPAADPLSEIAELRGEAAPDSGSGLTEAQKAERLSRASSKAWRRSLAGHSAARPSRRMRRLSRAPERPRRGTISLAAFTDSGPCLTLPLRSIFAAAGRPIRPRPWNGCPSHTPRSRMRPVNSGKRTPPSRGRRIASSHPCATVDGGTNYQIHESADPALGRGGVRAREPGSMNFTLRTELRKLVGAFDDVERRPNRRRDSRRFRAAGPSSDVEAVCRASVYLDSDPAEAERMSR